MQPDDPLFQVLTLIAAKLGLDVVTLVGLLPLIVLGSNIVGRLIPDDKTGVLGFVRKIAKVGGLYVSNRISSGIKVNDVVKVAAGLKAVEEVPELAETLVAAAPPALELDPAQAAATATQLFPGVGRDPATDRFQKKDS